MADGTLRRGDFPVRRLMRKAFLTIALLLGLLPTLPTPARAQTLIFGAINNPNPQTWTGINLFQQFGLPPYTVASPPSSPFLNQVAIFGSAATGSCTVVGAGTTLCYYTGV